MVVSPIQTEYRQAGNSRLCRIFVDWEHGYRGVKRRQVDRSIPPLDTHRGGRVGEGTATELVCRLGNGSKRRFVLQMLEQGSNIQSKYSDTRARAHTRTHTITCLVRNFLTEQIFCYIQFPYYLCPKYLGLHNRNIKAGKRNHILEAVCQFTGVRGQQARDQRHSLGPKLRAQS